MECYECGKHFEYWGPDGGNQKIKCSVCRGEHRCCECDNVMRGDENYSHGGSLFWCEACVKAMKTCHACGNELTEEMHVILDRKRYHQGCAPA